MEWAQVNVSPLVSTLFVNRVRSLPENRNAAAAAASVDANGYSVSSNSGGMLYTQLDSTGDGTNAASADGSSVTLTSQSDGYNSYNSNVAILVTRGWTVTTN